MGEKPESTGASEAKVAEQGETSATKLAALQQWLARLNNKLDNTYDPWVRRIAWTAAAVTAILGFVTWFVIPNLRTFGLLLWQNLPLIVFYCVRNRRDTTLAIVSLFCPIASIASLCAAGYIFVGLYPTHPHALTDCVGYLALSVCWAVLGIVLVYGVLLQLVSAVVQALEGQSEIQGRIVGVLDRMSQQQASPPPVVQVAEQAHAQLPAPPADPQ
jgi:hypothetical protein